jgi:hypothetical protein
MVPVGARLRIRRLPARRRALGEPGRRDALRSPEPKPCHGEADAKSDGKQDDPSESERWTAGRSLHGADDAGVVGLPRPAGGRLCEPPGAESAPARAALAPVEPRAPREPGARARLQLLLGQRGVALARALSRSAPLSSSSWSRE